MGRRGRRRRRVFRRIGRGIKRVGKKLAKSDIVQKAVGAGVSTFVPGGAAIVTGYKAARKGGGLVRKGRRALRAATSRPAITSALTGAAGGYMAGIARETTGGRTMGLPALSSGLIGKRGGPGLLPRGPGGKLQWPWQDPNIPAQLEQWACDDAYLNVTYRAPKGFVLWRNAKGKPFGLWKPVARMMGWKPKRKPPISVGDYRALMKADRTVRKMKSIVARTKRLRAVKAL